MPKFVLIDDVAVTPNLEESSIEVDAPTPIEAVAKQAGVDVAQLVIKPWGNAPDVWLVNKVTPKPDVCVMVVKR